MSSATPESPVNPIPLVVLALAAVIAGLELLFQLGARGIIGGPEAVGWRLNALQGWAFPPALLSWMAENGRWPASQVVRLVSYAFLHVSFTHTAFVLVFLLALGKMVGEIFHPLAVLAVFFGAAIAGALAYSMLPNETVPLIGGYPAVFGLIGAFTFLLWVRLAQGGGNQMRAFTLIGMLMVIQLIFSFVFDGGNEWVADLAGFAAGFLLSFVVSPGGWARVVDRLRQR